MADQRIGANFSIDVTQLKAGLSTANKLIRESQSEFKRASAGLDDWTKSEDGLKAKLKSLNEIIEIQREKVKKLNENYEKELANGMKETSDRAIFLRTQIKNEEAALAQNEAEIEKQTTALKKLQAAGGDAGKALEDTGKDAAKSSEGFTVMRGALADLVSSGFKMAINGAKKLSSALLDVGKKADELNTLSKQSGFTTTELQRFEYAAELVDVSVDDIIGSAKKLKKNLVSNSADTSAAFERIGVSVRDDVTGELRDANTIFYEVIKGLQGVENETERDTLAMQLLGKNADSLAGIIDDGGEALREYGDEAEELGIVLSEEAVDSANKFNDSIDKIKGTAQGVFAQIGAEIAGELTPAVETVQKEFQNIVKSGELKKYIKTAVDSVKNIVSVAFNLGKAVLPVVGKAVKFVADNFKTLAVVVGGAVVVFKAFKAVMAVTSAITAAKVAVAGLSAGVSVATKVQAGWNAVMAANPIGAVITAVALLAGGIALLTSSTDEATEAADHFNEKQREEYDRLTETTNAFMAAKDASDQLAAANISSVDYVTNSLLPELDDLVGANYEIKESDQARVNFILNELKNALGEEYGDLQTVIDQDGNLRDSIYKTIEAQKAQIYLEAYKDTYAEALKNKSAAADQFALSMEALSKAEADAIQLETDIAVADAHRQTALRRHNQEDFDYWDARLEELNGKSKDVKETLTSAQEDFGTSLKTYQTNLETISAYETASEEALKGNTQAVIDRLEALGKGYQNTAAAGSDALEAQKQIAERDVAYTQVLYRNLEKTHKESYENMTDTEKKELDRQLADAKSHAEKAIEQYNALGGNIVWGIADGMTEASWILTDKIKKMCDDMETAWMRYSDSHSPSRRFRKLARRTVGEGIALGLADATSSIVSKIKNQIHSVEGAYNFPTFNADGSGGVNFGAGRGVVVNQVNNYSQAHSRYEIYQSKKEAAAAVRLALDTI